MTILWIVAGIAAYLVAGAIFAGVAWGLGNDNPGESPGLVSFAIAVWPIVLVLAILSVITTLTFAMVIERKTRDKAKGDQPR